VVLLILEFIGTQELFLIMVVALVVFGPRKLPEIGRSIGKSLNEFRRASDEFKRTWQMEADLEKAEKEALVEKQENLFEANTAAPLPLPEVRDASFNNAGNDFAMPDNTTSNDTTTNDATLRDAVSKDAASNATPHVAETVPREPKRYAAPASTEVSDSAARS